MKVVKSLMQEDNSTFANMYFLYQKVDQTDDQAKAGVPMRSAFDQDTSKL